jgi:hypothetical protein
VRWNGLTVAGVRLAVEVPAELDWSWPEGPLRRFASDADDADLRVRVRVARPELPGGERIRYDSGGGIFDVARSGSDWLVALRIRGELQRLARLDADFREGEVVVSPDSFYARSRHYPLAYPLDELLVIHRLARDGGLLLHACGAVRDGRALLFTGRSGAGKTTIARFMLEAGCWVLSDDRIAIRPCASGFRVFGTPWHGDAPLASPESARLEAIHAIEQAPRLRARALCGGEAAGAVLGNAFLPVHDAGAAGAALELVERLVARVPVIRLAFPRDAAVVPFAWGEPRAGGRASPALA